MFFFTKVLYWLYCLTGKPSCVLWSCSCSLPRMFVCLWSFKWNTIFKSSFATKKDFFVCRNTKFPFRSHLVWFVLNQIRFPQKSSFAKFTICKEKLSRRISLYSFFNFRILKSIKLKFGCTFHHLMDGWGKKSI